MRNSAAVTTAINHLQTADPIMAELIARHGRCNIRPWQADPFHTLIRSIIGQLLSVQAAATIGKRVLDACGTNTYQPEPIYQSGFETLRACGLSNAKTKWCLNIAERTLNGSLSLHQLHKETPEEARKILIALPGIGHWSADMFMMFALGYPDILAVGDVGLQRGMEVAYGLRKRPSERTMTRISRSWRPYRSVASWYLWCASDGDNPKAKPSKTSGSKARRSKATKSKATGLKAAKVPLVTATKSRGKGNA